MFTLDAMDNWPISIDQDKVTKTIYSGFTYAFIDEVLVYKIIHLLTSLTKVYITQAAVATS